MKNKILQFSVKIEFTGEKQAPDGVKRNSINLSSIKEMKTEKGFLILIRNDPPEIEISYKLSDIFSIDTWGFVPWQDNSK